MAPKKKAAQPKAKKPTEEEQASNEDVKQAPDEAEAEDPQKEDKKEDTKPAAEQNSSKKRKHAPTKSEQPSKASRKSGRGGTKSQPTHEQLLNYLLSSEAEELCRPDDESQDLKSRPKSFRTYSTAVMNPFEELLCAVILSRPISHMLGLRSIRTLLNDPYNFTSAKAVKDAGEEKRLQALYDAKTQHNRKTAEQIGGLAEVVLEQFTSSGDAKGEKLGKLMDGKDVDEALKGLKDGIKGLGGTGLDIFLRRVQWLWTEGFPFVDGRTGLALKSFGLPQEAEELEKVIEENWKGLNTKGLAGKDENEKKRRAFVVVLERVTGANLEGKIDEAVQAAAAL
ncbi:unnamed protein product [Zymoseptoria tritici ST99CH_3D7]|uniref:HhH-GPD domain-containing protein n=3 Tax=Zymoseptoria tritici TaxID=1047171 RepID=A0A1X7RRP3_ZYMT9|nr:unnamed protein product [Zymoseptoria tritici ST99CH_3D7]